MTGIARSAAPNGFRLTRRSLLGCGLAGLVLW